MVKVVFPEESAFVFNAVQKPDVQEALAAALEKAAGAPVPFMYEQAGRQAVGVSANAQVAPASQAVTTAQGAQQAQPEDGTRQQQRSEAEPRQQQDARAAQPQPGWQSQQQSPQALSQQQPEESARLDAQPAARPQLEPQPQPIPSSDLPPYEEVPYEEVPYEEVPYEEFDGPFSSPGHSPQPEQAPWNGAAHDVSTAPSPGEPNLSPNGALVEDPSDVEALLQAGFGGGVVFSEVGDDDV